MNYYRSALAFAGLAALCACTSVKQDISNAEAEALKACKVANATVHAADPALGLLKGGAAGTVADVKSGFDALCGAGNEAALKAAAEADPTTAAWIGQQANLVLAGVLTGFAVSAEISGH